MSNVLIVAEQAQGTLRKATLHAIAAGREIAKRSGLKVSEYGVFRVSDDERVAASSEADVYEALGMDVPPPEIRLDLGEVVDATIEANGNVTATCRGTFVAVKEGHPAYHRW